MLTGLLATLKGVPRCSDAAAGAGACPEDSRVGTVGRRRGPGAKPFFMQGGVYLTGPYKRVRSGWRSWFPRRRARSISAGRGASAADRRSARRARGRGVRSVADDPQGRPDPLAVAQGRTSTAPNFISTRRRVGRSRAAASSARPRGAVVARSRSASPLRGAGAEAEAGRLTGKGQTTDGKHPAVKATVTQRRGEANLKRQVRLPLSLALDPDNAQALCEFADGTKVDPTCPKASIVGRATAVTPILDQPLTAPVYFVKNVRNDPKSGRQIRTLPMLVIPLRARTGSAQPQGHQRGRPRRPAGQHIRCDPGRSGDPVRPEDQGRQGRHARDLERRYLQAHAVAARDRRADNKTSDRNTTLTTPACRKGKQRNRR